MLGLQIILDSALMTSNSDNSKFHYSLSFSNFKEHENNVLKFIEQYSEDRGIKFQTISAIDDLGFDEIDGNSKIEPEDWYKNSIDQNNIVLIKDIDLLNKRSKKLDNLNSLLLYNVINGISFDKKKGHKFLFILISDRQDLSLFEKSQPVDINRLISLTA
jgi:hypothetical protein